MVKLRFWTMNSREKIIIPDSKINNKKANFTDNSPEASGLFFKFTRLSFSISLRSFMIQFMEDVQHNKINPKIKMG